MGAVAALYGECGGFGGQGRGADDDAGNTHEARDVQCVEVADRRLRGGRVQQELVLRQGDGGIGGGRVEDALGALLEGGFELCGS